jgi:hypothetical protein
MERIADRGYLRRVTKLTRRGLLDRASVRDRAGRRWTVEVTSLDRNDEIDADHWSQMTPEQRVELVSECLLDGLKTRGRRALPRFRRVYRVTQRPSR